MKWQNEHAVFASLCTLYKFHNSTDMTFCCKCIMFLQWIILDHLQLISTFFAWRWSASISNRIFDIWLKIPCSSMWFMFQNEMISLSQSALKAGNVSWCQKMLVESWKSHIMLWWHWKSRVYAINSCISSLRYMFTCPCVLIWLYSILPVWRGNNI